MREAIPPIDVSIERGIYACELRHMRRNKYSDKWVPLFIKKEKRKNEAHKVYFYYACVKDDVISYMTSSCRDEWNRLLLQ